MNNEEKLPKNIPPMFYSEFLGYRDVHRVHNNKKTNYLAFDFKVSVDSKKVKNGESHKFDAVEWHRLSDLPSPLHS